jgi:thiamine pyrophosphokinase
LSGFSFRSRVPCDPGNIFTTQLPGNAGSVLNWQKQLDGGGYNEISATTGLKYDLKTPAVQVQGLGCSNILIHAGAALTIDPGIVLTVNGQFTIEGQ